MFSFNQLSELETITLTEALNHQGLSLEGKVTKAILSVCMEYGALCINGDSLLPRT